MEPTQEQGNPLERKVNMSVLKADIEKDVEKRLATMARTVRMPGFRPGKVPMRIVAQQYGAQARSEALGEAVQTAFGNVVREQNLRVAGYPRIEPLTTGEDGQLGFSATFEVYPDVKIGELAGKDVKRPVLTVGDAEIDKTIDVLRKQRTSFVRTERAAEKGDRVGVDFRGTIDGEAFEGGSGTDFPILLGGGRMLPEFEAALLGMSADETKTFDLTFPDDYQATNLAGKKAQFEVTVKSVNAPDVPPLDEYFARSLGVEGGDLGKLREEVKLNLDREVAKRLKARTKDVVMNLLLEVTPIVVPRALVEGESVSLAESAQRDMEARGMDVKSRPVDPAWFAEAAERRVKLGLIVAEVAKAEGLFAKPEQIRAVVEDFSQSYQDPQGFITWYYSDKTRLAQVEAAVVEDNVVDWVLGKANTVDEAIDFDVLMDNVA